MNGQFAKDPAMPVTRAATEPEMNVEALANTQPEPLVCNNDLCRGGTEHHPSCKGLTKEQAKRKSKTK